MNSKTQTSATPGGKRFHLATMGCQMNTYDSDRLAALLIQEGYTRVEDPMGADLVLVNTCSVREKAEQKVYSYLGTFKDLKLSRPELIIGVGGCVAQQMGAKLLKRVPHLDLVFGPGALGQVPELVADAARGKRRVLVPEKQGFGGIGIQVPDTVGIKAMVTVMQGCDNFCTYCVVPYVRGRERSRPMGEVIEEINALVRAGAREVTLLGQNVNSYHDPESGQGFAALLERAAGVEGVLRIRFATSHPKDLSLELIEAMASIDKVMEQLHLPAQSGSDPVLKAMKRRYTREQYLERVARLRQLAPGLGLGGDVIVGFPGETDQDFKQTLSLVEQVRYDYLYSFKYSDRPFAKASRLENKVPGEVMARRLEILQARQNQISLELHQALEGSMAQVLVEGPAKRGQGLMTGRDRAGHAVNFPGRENLAGALVRVKITEGRVNSLMGAILEP